MKALDDTEFTIVGTGLMGGSLALALRGKVKTLRGVERDPAAREAAAPFFDEITNDLGAALGSDVIVLAVPIHAILDLLKVLGVQARPGTLIVDLGSSKQEIVQAMNVLPEHLQAVGGHAMRGKETSGPQNADAELFRDRPFVVCHTKRTTDAAWELVGAMIDAIGAQCISLNAEQHDQAVAVVSTLPLFPTICLIGR